MLYMDPAARYFPSMSFESVPPPAPRLLESPVAMRALAHPVRLRLRELLIRDGPMTSAEAGRALGISQALASHHLRQLAKYEFVVPAPSRDQREHRWQAAGSSLSATTSHSPAAQAPLEQLFAERALSRLLAWQNARADYDPAWQDNAGVSDQLIYVTAEELAVLQPAIAEALAPFRARNADPGQRPADAEPVAVFALAVPVPPTSRGN